MHPYRIGSLVGAVGATVFVLANRGLLPPSWSVTALVAWLGALGLYLWAVWLRPADRLPEAHPPRRHAGLIYLASVAGMILVIQVGRIVLTGQGREELMPAVIAVAVALHLLPFAAAFRTPVFTRLGWLMSVVGLVGLTLGWALDSGVYAALAAVVCGVLMLVVISAGALGSTRRTRSSR